MFLQALTNIWPPPLLVAPPEEGEDFQVIADDYEKYIIPGKFSIKLIT